MGIVGTTQLEKEMLYSLFPTYFFPVVGSNQLAYALGAVASMHCSSKAAFSNADDGRSDYPTLHS